MDVLMYYPLIKMVHILSSVLLVGTGFGSAFYLFFTNRTRNLPAQLEVARLVVRADWWFTTPAIIVQPLTGFVMLYLAGIAWDVFWVAAALILYVLAGLCWLPVVWLQIQMVRLLDKAVESGEQQAPPLYWVYARRWEWLGYPAFVAMLLIYYLMAVKPNGIG